jgi:adenylyl-sulfate kinase
MVDAGLIVITTFISPYRADRERVRKILEDSSKDFVEVFVKCPVDVCRQRDPKGLYKKAFSGEVKECTGVSAPYEEPLKPELVLETDKLAVSDCVARIVDYLREFVYVEKRA